MKAVSKNQLIFIRDTLLETKETKEPALDLEECLEMVEQLVESEEDINLEALLNYNATIEAEIKELEKIYDETA